jgi:molecular chaperone GrpE
VSETPHTDANPEAEPGEAVVTAPKTAGAAEPAPPDPPAPQVAELEDRWRRALADLDNLRKRYARELTRERQFERDRIAAAWLPVLDGLERALEHADADPEVIVAGVRAVADQAIALLAALGYPRQDEVGVPFDTAVHEAVAAVPDSEAPPGTVLRVVRPGYGELRPAAVTVSQRD